MEKQPNSCSQQCFTFPFLQVLVWMRYNMLISNNWRHGKSSIHPFLIQQGWFSMLCFHLKDTLNVLTANMSALLPPGELCIFIGDLKQCPEGQTESSANKAIIKFKQPCTFHWIKPALSLYVISCCSVNDPLNYSMTRHIVPTLDRMMKDKLRCIYE